VVLLKKKYLIILFIFITLGGCKSKNSLYDTSKIIFEAKNYSAVADITINGNKGISKYKIKQYYIQPNKLRLETLEPSFLKGKVIVLYENKWKVYHPLINDSFEIPQPKDDDALILMGVIDKSDFINKSAEFYNSVYKNVNCVCIKSIIQGGNKFRYSAILYINEKSKLPMGMTILDEKGEINIEIVYSEFKLNGELKSSLFMLE
jgi:outer membrane lipoprotein-sorting protein